MFNISLGTRFVGSVLALMFVSSANANLIVNGDFETVTLDGYVHSWGVSDLYEEDDVVAWDANGKNGHIELWTVGNNSFAELNADWSNSKNWLLSQQVQNFELGVEYNFSFDYKSRKNDNEAFQFKVKGSDGLNGWSTIDDHDDPNIWHTYAGLFTATKADHLLRFRAVNGGDTYGNFIDNVSITKAAVVDVPEPHALYLLGLALVGLGLRKKIS